MRFVGDLGALLRVGPFRRLFAVRVTSQCADGIFQVALASYILFSPERQPDAGAIAAALAAVLLPFSVLGPFTGVFLDRWSRRQVLFACNVVRVIPVLTVAATIAADRNGPLLYVLVVTVFSINRFFLAGLSAALPHVVERNKLVLANAVTPTSGTIAFIVGLGLGAGVRQITPSGHLDVDVAIVVVAGATYLLAALLTIRVPRDQLGPDERTVEVPLRHALSGVLHGLTAGLRHLRQRPTAGSALVAIAAHRFFYGLSTVATILLYRNYFHDSTETSAGLAGLSVAVLVSGLGFLTAAILTPLATERMSPQLWTVALLAVAAVAEAFPGGLYTESSLLVAAFLLGISAQGIKICVDTLVQTFIDDAYRGRVFSLYDVGFNVVFVAAAAVGAVIIPPNGKSYIVLIFIAAGYAVTAFLYWRAQRRADEARQPGGSLVDHQASSSSRALSSPRGPSSIRRSSRNRYASPTAGPGGMSKVAMICWPSRSGRIAASSSCAARRVMRFSRSS
jgi:MFS family permease